MKNGFKIVLCLCLLRVQIATAAVGTQPVTTPPPTTTQTDATSTYPDLLSNQKFLDAKKTIEDARQRTDLVFATDADEAAFENLIAAYVTVHWLDDGPSFVAWWKQNKTELVRFAPAMGPGVDWEVFLRNLTLAYNAQAKTPTEYKNYLERILANPATGVIMTNSRWLALAVLAVIGGATYQAIVNGPFVTTLNSFLKPWVEPITQKAGTLGVRYFGRSGKKLNAKLFKPKIMTLKQQEARLKELRGIIFNGQQYSTSASNLARFMEQASQIWNGMNHTYSEIPEAYRSGRSLLADIVIFRPADFAIRVTTSMNAAATVRGNALAEIGRVQARFPQNHDQLENNGVELDDLLAREAILQRQGNVEGVNQIRAEVREVQATFRRLGASPRQAKAIVDDIRLTYIYRQQAAGFLASKIYHDTNYSDITSEVGEAFKTLQDNYALDHFTQELNAEVGEIVNRLGFSIESQIGTLEQAIEEGVPPKSALEVTRKLNSSTESIRAVEDPSSLEHAKKETPLDALHEQSVRAIRR